MPMGLSLEHRDSWNKAMTYTPLLSSSSLWLSESESLSHPAPFSASLVLTSLNHQHHHDHHYQHHNHHHHRLTRPHSLPAWCRPARLCDQSSSALGGSCPLANKIFIIIFIIIVVIIIIIIIIILFKFITYFMPLTVLKLPESLQLLLIDHQRSFHLSGFIFVKQDIFVTSDQKKRKDEKCSHHCPLDNLVASGSCETSLVSVQDFDYLHGWCWWWCPSNMKLVATCRKMRGQPGGGESSSWSLARPRSSRQPPSPSHHNLNVQGTFWFRYFW